MLLTITYVGEADTPLGTTARRTWPAEDARQLPPALPLEDVATCPEGPVVSHVRTEIAAPSYPPSSAPRANASAMLQSTAICSLQPYVLSGT